MEYRELGKTGMMVSKISFGASSAAAWGLSTGLAAAAVSGMLVVGATWWGSTDLRSALAR